MNAVRKTYVHSHQCPWEDRRVTRVYWVTEDGVYYETEPRCAHNDAVLELLNTEEAPE